MSTTASASFAKRVGRVACGLLCLALGGCAAPQAPEKPSARALLDERFPHRARTVREDDGRWIADWLANRWALAYDRTMLRRHLDAELKKGYSIEEALLVALPSVGLWTHAAYGTWPELVARLQGEAPVVVQLGMTSGPRRVRRFAVVTAIDPIEGSVRTRMQDGADVLFSKDEFLARWSSYRNWMLIACPPESARWPMRSAERMSLIRYNDLVGRVDAADALAAEALELDPSNADLLTALGTRALLRGRKDEAEALFRAALRADDRHAPAANNLAYLLGERGGDLEEALALARRATLLEPSNPRILHTYGSLLGKAGRWEESRLNLERAWERANVLPLAARIEVGCSLALAYYSTASPHLACGIIQALRRKHPDLQLPKALQAQLDLAGDCL